MSFIFPFQFWLMTVRTPQTISRPQVEEEGQQMLVTKTIQTQSWSSQKQLQEVETIQLGPHQLKT